MKILLMLTVGAFLLLAILGVFAFKAWCHVARLDNLSLPLSAVALVCGGFLTLAVNRGVASRVTELKTGRVVPLDARTVLQVTPEDVAPAIWIGYVNDGEAEQLARRLREAFQSAGWQPSGNQPPHPVPESFEGIRFTVLAGPKDPDLLRSHLERQGEVRSVLRLLRERYEEIPNPSEGGIGSIVVGSMTCQYPLPRR